jgi:hydroxyethylthiazole kinase-like uncharacterized protein yjeF
VHEALPVLLARCPRLVLDADALNRIAADPGMKAQLVARAGHGRQTVLTPHPLEAARLLGCEVAAVQADRLRAVHALAQQLQAVVLLKGSGSVIAQPQGCCALNPTGNALLASGGTGDVLAGWIGGLWAQRADEPGAALGATVAAAWLHGRAAEVEAMRAGPGAPMRAADLVETMRTLQAAAGA